MIRLVQFYWHRLRADSWRRHARARMRDAQRHFIAHRLSAHRAARHDDRAEALYPPRSTGPPPGDAPRDAP